MQWPEVKTHWKEVQGKFQVKWNKLPEADLTAIAGKREELISKIAKVYKADKLKTEKEVDEFVKGLKPLTAKA